nr:mannosylglycoprotein endo-beta-mannosidase [Quercus suber]
MYRKHSLDVADILHPDDWKKCCHTIRSGLGLEGSYKPVKIFDLHLVSLFFDDFKRVYLHATTELENRRAWVAECSLNVQVTMGVEGNICLVEHLQTLHLSFLAGSHMQYMFPEVWQEFWSTADVEVVTCHGFNPEVGSVGMVVAYTIRATMSQEGWQILLIELYGTPKDLDDFFFRELCWSARLPINTQLNLATYFIEQVVNATSEELSNIAIEALVWDLEEDRLD